MLRVNELIDDVMMPSGKLNDEDMRLFVVVSDYEGKLHNVVAENIQHDYNEGQLILELHSEIEDGSA